MNITKNNFFLYLKKGDKLILTSKKEMIKVEAELKYGLGPSMMDFADKKVTVLEIGDDCFWIEEDGREYTWEFELISKEFILKETLNLIKNKNLKHWTLSELADFCNNNPCDENCPFFKNCIIGTKETTTKNPYNWIL